MLLHRMPRLFIPPARKRRLSFQFRVEPLESRAMLSLTAINFNATVTSAPVAMNGELFFRAESPTSGSQLWESNGTSSGTVMLTDINATYGGLDPSDLTVVGNTVYFVADNGPAGQQLWSSNGTASGTVMVSDVDPGIGLLPSDLTNVNGSLDFVAYNPTDGYQLYTSNGTAAGTVMVADIDGTNGSNPSDLTAVGSTVYFSATDGVHGYQLWESNGTASGTVMVADINATVGSFPDELTAVGSSVYFAGFDSVHGYQLWESNGTASGTVMLTSSNASGGGLAPSNMAAVGNTLYFAGNDGVHGYQLWDSNGTASGTVMLTSGNAADGGLAPANLTALGSTLFFTADDGVHGPQLWSSTGTASGTALFAEINGASGSDPGELTVMNGELYFSAYNTANGSQVWQSNGTSSGTTMVTNSNGASGIEPSNMMASSSALYFTGTGATLWQWQSTTAVTPKITWSSPANIVYGTALSATQLDATATWTSGGTTVTVPGTFTYSPAAGTLLGAGNNQTLSVTFEPTNTTQYTAATATATINVLKATPTIAWPSPANIGYAIALSTMQLDATASAVSNGSSVSVPGTFTYTPAAGAVLNVGNNQTLSMSFAPTDTNDYVNASATTTVNVVPVAPTISWPTPANITYGTALSGAQLDATATWTTGGTTVTVPGTFTYTPAASTLLGAGNNQTLSVTFTPTNTSEYGSASTAVTINVLKSTPTITWSNPATIVYGTALGATQLNATATSVTAGANVSVPGTFTYTPAAGTVLGAGNNQTLSVSFSPTNTTNFAGTTATATINVLKATPTIAWPSPANIGYGTALSAMQLDATASAVSNGSSVSVPGTFTYTPAAGAVLNVGNNQTLSMSFAPTDTTDYVNASATTTVNVVPVAPTISWPTPANITYGTALSGAQLDATATWSTGGTTVTVPGTFTYTPAAGTLLGAGNNQTLSVTFTPTSTSEYGSASTAVNINVLKSTPTIIWSNPATIVYGTALGATQLNATATSVTAGANVSVPGTFTYTPAAGTVLGAGNNQTLSVSFSPINTTNFVGTTATATINVLKASPTIAWPSPANIGYGTALSATQLDATASAVSNGSSVSVPGTFTYTPAAGAVLNVGSNQTLSVSFAPTDTTDYVNASATTTVNVVPVAPTISWPTPANITYGTALSGAQLDATARWTSSGTTVTVPGTFTYIPAAGTLLGAGNNQTLSVTFTPTNSSEYGSASTAVTINVLKSTPTITWSNPATIVYGTALSATQLNAKATSVTAGANVSVPGTFTYTPAAGTLLGAGNNQTLSVTFEPTDTTQYTAATATAPINVLKASPTIAWPSPANIGYGTALSATQLDATASAVSNGSSVSVPGTFTYTPAAGAVLNVGNNQTLSVSFAPTDTTDYVNASATTTVNVVPVAPTISWPTPANIRYGTALSGAQLDATVTWTSSGTTATVPGTFTYTPAAGTLLGAGNNQTLSVTFTPTNTSEYGSASTAVTINVLKSTPTITWSNPATIVYGTALGATQLNAKATSSTAGATASVPGTFTYTPAAGTVLGAGNNQTLSVSFSPRNATDYAGESAMTTISVVKATPTITWASPANIVYGTALSVTQLDATASCTTNGTRVSVPGTFIYMPAAGTVLAAASNQKLSVSFTPTNTTEYADASATTTITVLKATPTINWAPPANIIYGAALGATQLDATASWRMSGTTVSVPGEFTYTPPAGTVLGVGNNQKLSVSFTPTNTIDYTTTSATTTVTVVKVTPTINSARPADIGYGTAPGGTESDVTASWTSRWKRRKGARSSHPEKFRIALRMKHAPERGALRVELS